MHRRGSWHPPPVITAACSPHPPVCDMLNSPCAVFVVSAVASPAPVRLAGGCRAQGRLGRAGLPWAAPVAAAPPVVLGVEVAAGGRPSGRRPAPLWRAAPATFLSCSRCWDPAMMLVAAAVVVVAAAAGGSAAAALAVAVVAVVLAAVAASGEGWAAARRVAGRACPLVAPGGLPRQAWLPVHSRGPHRICRVRRRLARRASWCLRQALLAVGRAPRVWCPPAFPYPWCPPWPPFRRRGGGVPAVAVAVPAVARATTLPSLRPCSPRSRTSRAPRQPRPPPSAPAR